MGVREDDAVRQLPGILSVLREDINALKEDNKYMKELLRAIKKSVVRKYGSQEEDVTSG